MNKKEILTLVNQHYARNNILSKNDISFTIPHSNGEIKIIDKRDIGSSGNSIAAIKRGVLDFITYLMHIGFSGKITYTNHRNDNRNRTSYLIESDNGLINKQYRRLQYFKEDLEKVGYRIPGDESSDENLSYSSMESYTISTVEEKGLSGLKIVKDVLEDKRRGIIITSQKVMNKDMESVQDSASVKLLKSLYRECLPLDDKVTINITGKTAVLKVGKDLLKVVNTDVLVKTIKGAVYGANVV